jgi:hypothetical protein
MQEKINDDFYSLDDLIECLEDIKEKGHGELNFPKAFYCLALEIRKLKQQSLEYKMIEDAKIFTDENGMKHLIYKLKTICSGKYFKQ